MIWYKINDIRLMIWYKINDIKLMIWYKINDKINDKINYF